MLCSSIHPMDLSFVKLIISNGKSTFSWFLLWHTQTFPAATQWHHPYSNVNDNCIFISIHPRVGTFLFLSMCPACGRHGHTPWTNTSLIVTTKAYYDCVKEIWSITAEPVSLYISNKELWPCCEWVILLVKNKLASNSTGEGIGTF